MGKVEIYSNFLDIKIQTRYLQVGCLRVWGIQIAKIQTAEV